MHDGNDHSASAFARVLGPQRLNSDDSYGTDEFPEGATDWMGEGTNRRTFLKLMSAGLAMAGLVGCNDRPTSEEIVPHVDPPEAFVPGKPVYYASAMPLNGCGKGVRVTSREGRPIKIEGNPEHPASLGGTDVFMQASVLDLYDPARAKTPTRGGSAVDWATFRSALKQRTDAARQNGGAGLRVLSGTITSPTLQSQIAEAARQFPNAQWHVYDPMARNSMYAATAATFGRALNVVYDFTKARTVVSLDSDFLFEEPGSVRYARDFMDGRRVSENRDKAEMNRLYVIESSLTLTGSTADHRFPRKPSEIADFAQRLLKAVTGGSESDKVIAEIARDLLATPKGQSLVLAGPGQPASVHAAAYAINAALGNIGQAIKFTEPLELRPNDPTRSLKALVDDMKAGKVDTLIIVGDNPAFTAPADIDFAGALEAMSKEMTVDGKFKNFTAHLSLYQNETSFLSQWHLPEAHYLEAWGDVRAYDGTVSIIQPLIAPLYGGRSASEVLAEALGGATTGYEIVRNHWKTQVKADFEPWWRATLKRGIIADSDAPTINPGAPRGNALAATADAPAGKAGEFEIVFRPDYTIWDGSFNRNAWLLELPKPFTKLVWDNAALVSPATAAKLNATQNDLLHLSIDGKAVEAPVFSVPGLPDDTITLTLGWGAGRRPALADDNIGVHGFNAYAVRRGQIGFDAVQVRKLDKTYHLVSTMSHHAMWDAKPQLKTNAIVTTKTDPQLRETLHRRLIRVIGLDEFKANPETARDLGGLKDKKPLLSLYGDGGWDYSKGYQWGMSIDTTTCIGCNACVVACQSENNIPVVGKEQVDRQREMHWIRIDDYFAEAPDQPLVTHQPVTCMHCEQAPCEYVCPVGATSHSAEGLNQMTYNRCVGTRYCSNNCPYKVRRFNFFNFGKPMQEEHWKLRNNPEVTVRTRGVMEKCSYCVQRIARTRIEVEAMLLDMEDLIEKTTDANEKARLTAEKNTREYEMINGLQTACQQGCPTRAIVFGSINLVAEKPTPVMALKDTPQNKNPLDYTLLRELTTKPRTSYQVRVRNTNPALA